MARPVGFTQNVVVKKPSQKAIIQRIRALEALHHTALAINQQQDLNALLRAIVHRAAELLHAHMGGLYLMRPDGQSLELVVTYNLPGDFAGVVLRLGEGLSGRVAATGETMVVEDYMNWPGRAAVYEGQPFRRVVGVPLKIQDRVIGVINITDDVTVGPFDPEEVRLVQLFAEHAALVIQNSRLLADTRRQNATLESLYELAVAITGVLDQETLLWRLCEQAAHLLHFDAFGVALCEDPPGTTYHLALAIEEGRPVPELHDRHFPFSAGRTSATRPWRTTTWCARSAATGSPRRTRGGWAMWTLRWCQGSNALTGVLRQHLAWHHPLCRAASTILCASAWICSRCSGPTQLSA